MTQIALTNSSVKSVVQILPKLIALTKTYQGPATTDTNTVKKTKYEAFKAALNKLSGSHGFTDTRIMQRTVETTMLTAGFIKSGRTLEQVDKQLTATRQLIEKNPKLTAQQKTAMLQRMTQQISMVVPTKENIKTVRPLLDRIFAITSKK